MNNKLNIAVLIVLSVFGWGIACNSWADAESIDDGVIVYFPFSKQYGLTDVMDWLQIEKPTRLGTFPDRFGMENSACDFKNLETGSWSDPAQSYIKIPDQCEVRFRNAFSFSVWVYFIDYPGHKDSHVIAKKMTLFILQNDNFTNDGGSNSLQASGVPEEIIEQLQILKDKEYKEENEKDEFIKALEATIGTDQLIKYKTPILEKTLREAVNSYNLWVTRDNVLSFYLRKNASEHASVNYQFLPERVRVWTHIAAVWDGSFMRLYINGNKEDEVELNGDIAYNEYDSNPVYIGADNQNSDPSPEEGWNGYMDDFRIYNRGLSESEIQQLQYINDSIDKSKSDFVKVKAGSQEADFKMVSFNYNPDNPHAPKVFGAQLLGGYNTDIYRIGTYDPIVGDYVEYGENLEITPGKAYWVYAKNGLDIRVDGTPVCKNDDIEIELLYNKDQMDGWNMIATPNNATYVWNDIEVVVSKDGYPKSVSTLSSDDDVISKRLWRWEDGSYLFYSPSPDSSDGRYDSSNPCLEPHEGYWVRVNTEKLTDNEKIYLRFRANTQNDICPDARTVKSNKTSLSYSQDDDEYPPSPLNGFSKGNIKIIEEGDSGGCFIDTVSTSSIFAKYLIGIVSLLMLSLIVWRIIPIRFQRSVFQTVKRFFKSLYLLKPLEKRFYRKHRFLKANWY
jgi:hypothetical protein